MANFPKSDNKGINALETVVSGFLKANGLSFVVQENDLYPDEVGAFFGALPLFLFKAKDNYDKVYKSLPDGDTQLGLLKKDFPIEFLLNEDAYFNVEPYYVDNAEVPLSFVLHLAHFSVEEFVNQFNKNKMLLVDGKIPLDSLYGEWVEALESNKILVKRPTEGQLSNSLNKMES